MLAHESEVISYNSQVIVEFAGDFDPKAFQATLKKAVCEIPWLRTKVTENFFRFDRHILSAEEINEYLLLRVLPRPLTPEEIDEFCGQKFDLKNGHSFEFLVAPLEGNKTQLIFNVHHTLCDAAGQFLLLEEILRLHSGLPVREEAKKTKVFRYRHLYKIMGAKWFLSKLWENRKSLKKQRLYKMAGLIDHPEYRG